MWLARRADNDPMAESSGGMAGVDNALRGFVTAGSLLGTRVGSLGRVSGFGGTSGRRGGLFGRSSRPRTGGLKIGRIKTARIKAVRIKGVKRL
jgi:hypothetical protein